VTLSGEADDDLQREKAAPDSAYGAWNRERDQ